MPTALTTNGSCLEEAGMCINAKDRKAMLTMHGRICFYQRLRQRQKHKQQEQEQQQQPRFGGCFFARKVQKELSAMSIKLC